MLDEVQPGDVNDGKHRVDRMIGAGGMGVVLTAEHVALRERVALKPMRPEAMGSKEQRRHGALAARRGARGPLAGPPLAAALAVLSLRLSARP
ncbi:hypothetical protein WME91_33385 [Sorangium sp. So ce269]